MSFLCDKSLLFYPLQLLRRDVSGSHGYSQVVGKDEVEIVCITLNILEVDAEIAIQFPRAPHATPLAESPPPPPMMAEDGPPAVRGKEDGSARVTRCAKVSCM